ncbi:hypothetical protein QJS10_CPA01g00826 [Acorus calamus]|uniref:Uncharacterized protein n=1 Tax=Acorus calamus TaxID=4465 RepID=A0AAV9FRW2_ACOCL|nr:hypothetical protein QJS10_CPA01g00826 [Acorus calamus]
MAKVVVVDLKVLEEDKKEEKKWKPSSIRVSESLRVSDSIVGSPDSRIDYLTHSSPDARLSLASSIYGVLPELLRMLAETHTPAAIDATLACLITLSVPRCLRTQVVPLGLVPALTRIMAAMEEDAGDDSGEVGCSGSDGLRGARGIIVFLHI